MSQVRHVILGGSALVLLLSLLAPAHGQFVPAGLSPLEQATRADIIIVGKVTDLEPELVLAERHKGAGKVAHLVATIRVEEGLLGAKGLTHVRVGFVPEIAVPEPDPNRFLG